MQSIADDYVEQWQTLAISSDGSHLTLSVSLAQSHLTALAHIP